MEWQQIAGFYHLAKLGSFTRAAEATFRTQSALSQQIKALEEELDCRLVERIGKRKLRLTPPGERLLAFAEAVLVRREQLQEELNGLKSLKTGRLRLAAPFTTLYHLCREPLGRFRQQFPQVKLTILDRSQPEVIELVKGGEVDLGLALESLAPRDLAAGRWLPVEMALMTPVDHPLARAKRVTLRQIARYPLILPPPGAGGRRRLEERLQERALDYRVVMESSNVELSSLYVEMGLGISFATLARGVPPAQSRNLAFIPLSRYFPRDYLAVVRRRDKVLAAAHLEFLKILLGGPGA
jgi:DNA-binding transcriptional LysR family regulator